MPWITRPGRTYYSWQDVPHDVVPDDRALKSVLVDRFKENIFTQDAHISVEVDHRAVVLEGEVDSWDAKKAAGDDAWDTPGVLEVNNELVVAGAA